MKLRPAEAADAEFLLELAWDPAVEPFMAPIGPRNRDEMLERLERAAAQPEQGARLVIEQEGSRAGALAYEVVSVRSRTVSLHGVMLHPDARGRGVAEAAVRMAAGHLIGERGFHRVQLECYGFNERAIRLFERAGFVREGVKRRAYWRHGDWADGVLFSVIEDDLPAEAQSR